MRAKFARIFRCRWLTGDGAFGADDIAGVFYTGEKLRKQRFLMTDNSGLRCRRSVPELTLRSQLGHNGDDSEHRLAIGVEVWRAAKRRRGGSKSLARVRAAPLGGNICAAAKFDGGISLQFTSPRRLRGRSRSNP